MGSPRRVSLALAGPGPVDLDNAKALLNDFLGFGPEDDEGFPEHSEDVEFFVRLPITESHMTEGMEVILDWLDYADVVYDVTTDGKSKSREVRRAIKHADEVGEADNVNASVVNWLRDQEGEKYLVLAWGEEGDQNAEILLDLAESYTIKCLDLTQGLDALGFGTGATVEETTPAPEPEAAPEPEPTPEPAPKPRRTRKAAAPKPEEPKELTVESVREKVEAERAPEPTKDDAEIDARFRYHPATTTTGPQHDAVRSACHDLFLALDGLLEGDSREKSLAMTKIEEAMMWANAHVARNHVSRGRGRPRKGV